MAIEIIPKKRDVGGSPIGAITWYVGLGLLLLSILVSVSFLLLTQRTIRKIEETKIEIEAKKSPRILVLEAGMRGDRQRVLDFAHILNSRVSPIPMLKVIERNMHPGVFLSDIRVDVAGREIKANAIARDIVVFDQQKRIFEKDKTIASFNIGEFIRGDGGNVSFPITIKFSDQLLNLNNGQ